MANNTTRNWNLAAAILLWLAAIINAGRIPSEGATAMNTIPAVAFAISGLLFLWGAIRQEK